MALNDISLTASMRSNLISLQGTATLLSRTQERLSTGKKVNTALDNPTNFFAAQTHTQRAADLTSRKDGMTEAVQGVQAANKGITAITALIESAKGLTQAARSADASNRNNLATQFNVVLTQITQLASDSVYKGKNFLKDDTLQVLFNENGSSSLSIVGFSATATGLGISNVTEAAAATTAAGPDATSSGINTTTSGAVGLTGATTSVNINTHAATLSATSNYIQGYNVYASISGLVPDTIAAGDTFALSGFTDAGYGGLDAGAITLAAVYVNGVTGNVGDFAITGSSGAFSLGIVNAPVTGASISFDLQIAGHDTNGSTTAVNMTVFDLAAGDKGSGITLLNTYNAANGTGAAIYVDSTYVGNGTTAGGGATSAWVSGNQIIFTGVAVPHSGSVTYTYNSGFVSGSTMEARTMSNLDYKGANIGAGESVTAVRVNGTAISGNYYSVNGSGKVTFTTQAVLDGKIKSGDQVGIDTRTAEYTVTVGATLTTGQYITTGSVMAGTNNLSGYITINGADITIDSGAFTAGLINSGDTISYTVSTPGVGGGWSFNASGVAYTNDTGIDASVTQLNTAIDTLRTQSANLASSMNVVTVREDFTDGMVNTLLKGADNLTLADMNEEGANMLMLQTRQQLGTTSLKMASDAAQAVLRLF